jgi:hypothetical protein
VGDRRLPDDENARRRQVRLEEDLQRTAAQARVLLRDGAVARRSGAAARLDAQQQRLADRPCPPPP